MSRLRETTRALLKSWRFSLLVIVILAIAVGVTATIYSIADAVLLRPLPWRQPDQLVNLGHRCPGLGNREFGLSQRLYLHYLEHSESFEGLAIFQTSRSAARLDEPVRVRVALITPGLFGILGSSPSTGRELEPRDSEPGQAGVVIVSDGFWRNRLGADPEILSRSLVVDGTSRQVVGVMPPGFDFPRSDVELWLPMVIDRSSGSLAVFAASGIGRLRAGVSLAAATTDLRRFTRDPVVTFPDEDVAPILADAGFDVALSPYRESVVGDVRAPLGFLMASVSLLFLLAVFNVATLFLARSESRQGEMAIRAAMGASRRAMLVSALLESAVLSLVSAGAGLALARIGVGLVKRTSAFQLPRLASAGVDARTSLFALALAVLCGTTFGVLPLLRWKPHLLTARLTDQSRSADIGRRRHRARKWLVGLQAGIAVTLLIGSGLLVRSFGNLLRVDPGFSVADRVGFSLSLPSKDAVGSSQTLLVYDRILARLREVRGVESVATTTALPLSGQESFSGVSVPGHGEGGPSFVPTAFVSEDYFTGLGIPLLSGRLFERNDWLETRRTAIVSRSFAVFYWPGEPAVGKVVLRSRLGPVDEQMTVVGVVADVKSSSLADPPGKNVYWPWDSTEDRWSSTQNQRSQSVVVTFEAGVRPDLRELRAAVWAVAPDLPISDLQTLDELIRSARARRAHIATLAALASAVAILLATVGVYGLVAYLAEQRRPSLAIRLALGADRLEVLAVVLKEGLGSVGLGVILGVIASSWLCNYLRFVLFAVSPRDPVVFVAAPVAVLILGLAASLAPAIRAARTQPATMLRSQ